MRDLRIVFMGTPEFAVTILKGLLENKYKVVGVITAPDRPAGRGQKLRQSAVKEYAVSQNLTVLQPTNLKNEDFLTELKALDANLQIIVAFRMLPKVVWAMPEYGTFNLHASLLPQYRGAAPINWAIINGETKTGVTTFFIDEKIDTGAIILQNELEIGADENAGSLHDRLMVSGSDLVVKTVKAIAANEVTTKIQPQSEDLKTAYKLFPDNTKIDWKTTSEKIHNHIRGLSPYPGAWCYLENGDKEERVKIYGSARLSPDKGISQDEIGAITAVDKAMIVSTEDGGLIIEEIQLSGKRKMDVKALLNGYNFDENAKMR